MLSVFKLTFLFCIISILYNSASAQKINTNDYENKAQAYAILSAQYSTDAYYYARQNFFKTSINEIKKNCDTALVYSEIAIEYADSAVLMAHDTSVYAKEIMLVAKEYLKKGIKIFNNIRYENDSYLILALSEKSIYTSGNAVADGYKASLEFAWKVEPPKEEEKEWGNEETEVNEFGFSAGVRYRIQIGFFKRKLPIDYFEGAFPIKSQISHYEVKMKGVDHYRHVAGNLMKYDQAKMVRQSVLEKGYEDAFIVAFIDGKKVPVGVALEKEREEDEVVVDNREITRLESDEHSYLTIKDLYGKRLKEIDEELLLLNNQVNTVERKKFDQINNVIDNLKKEREKCLEKMKGSEDRLVNVRNELSEEMLQIVHKDIFTTDKDGFYDEDVPIPSNNKIPNGLVFKVQIGFFKSQLSPEHFDGIFPLSSQKVDDTYYRYVAGNFPKYTDAKAAQNTVIEKGYADSFVIAFFNGEKISISEALKKEKDTD